MDRLNRAYIILIPKVEGVERIGDFRPISLSNSIYLIIAKVLANQLRTVRASAHQPFSIGIHVGSADGRQHRVSGGDCRFLAAE